MAAGDVTEVRDHDGQDQPVGKRDPNEAGGVRRTAEDHHGAGADEDEGERADDLGDRLFPDLPHACLLFSDGQAVPAGARCRSRRAGEA